MSEVKLDIAVQALRDVADPIGMFRRELEPGERLDGAGCVALLNSPQTYKNIATDALLKMGFMEPEQQRICREREWKIEPPTGGGPFYTVRDEATVAIGAGTTERDAFFDAFERTRLAYQ